ncbi:MAG TPA: SRPBCC family protein [Candidatus Binataceae bacterium]|nr:SRPBCC family protein [Candidatus Binataceae bacterium]
MQWPDGMEPEHATVFAHNELVIPAAPATIWRWLCRASGWPNWYSNCRWLKFRDGDGPDLAASTAFVWKTFGVRVRSTVIVFDPEREIGWDATAFGLRAYHVWQLEVLDGNRTRVITEETQHGPLTTIGRWYLRRGLLREHQNWLESLSRMAQSGEPV